VTGVLRLGLVGFGKIARDQHAPAIAADPRFELAAVASPEGDPAIGVPWFAETAALFEALHGRLDAVAVCTPPKVRHGVARAALAQGLAVLLEKPPATTLGELDALEHAAASARCGLYAAWHSQHAPAVPIARSLLAQASVKSTQIAWFEDVRKWHPGQRWIWDAGGFGVFDPGINALSIASRILPAPLLVADADLTVPANCEAPIAADLEFVGANARAAFDWRYTEGERWSIRVETADGRTIALEEGGARLFVDGDERAVPPASEYASIYDTFAGVCERREVSVDREPLRIVADAFLVGRRTCTEPFG
jgi:predicted dehydrogenase